MHRLFLLLPTLLTTLFLLTACLPDSQVDVEEVKRQIRQVRVSRGDLELPDKEEFRQRAEREIIKMPLDEQPLARRQLDSMLAVYPTEEQLDSIIHVVAEALPDEATTDEIVDEVVRELPSKTKMKEVMNEFIDNLPTESEVGDILKVGISQLRNILDSLEQRPQ